MLFSEEVENSSQFAFRKFHSFLPMLCMTGSVRPTCTRLSRCWYLGSHLALEIQLGEYSFQRMTPNRDLARNRNPNGLTEAQYGQTWHLSTQLPCAERTGHRFLWSASLLLPTLLSDSQVLISLVIHGLRWTVSGQVKAHVVLTCTNGILPNHLPVIVASNRPWTTLSTRTH